MSSSSCKSCIASLLFLACLVLLLCLDFLYGDVHHVIEPDTVIVSVNETIVNATSSSSERCLYITKNGNEIKYNCTIYNEMNHVENSYKLVRRFIVLNMVIVLGLIVVCKSIGIYERWIRQRNYNKFHKNKTMIEMSNNNDTNVHVAVHGDMDDIKEEEEEVEEVEEFVVVEHFRASAFVLSDETDVPSSSSSPKKKTIPQNKTLIDDLIRLQYETQKRAKENAVTTTATSSSELPSQ